MGPTRVDALVSSGEYRSRATEVVTDTSGQPVVELSVVPRLLVARTIGGQRAAPPLARPDRTTALAAAAEVFETGVVAGLDFEDYVALTHRISGLPLGVTRASARDVVDGLRHAVEAVAPARPVGASEDWRDLPPSGGAVWARRGEVLGVHAPGNAPGVHALWPQALALGYRVAVRPSRREPLTAHRLVTSLRSAGFRDTDVAFLPTDHPGAQELVRSADLALVYGGADVAERYLGDPRVLVNGPGRSKILVTADRDWRVHLDAIVDSIARFGGMACVNATAVLVEGDPAPLARAIAERLAGLPDDALPTATVAAARALSTHVARVAGAAEPLLGPDQIVSEGVDGRAVLRPAVHLLGSPDPAVLNVELPFPCVWVAPWTREHGLAPLRQTLVLNLVSGDTDLIDLALAEPSVVNVYVGRVSTVHSAPHIPHEGFLADFLMRNKGCIRLDENEYTPC